MAPQGPLTIAQIHLLRFLTTGDTGTCIIVPIFQPQELVHAKWSKVLPVFWFELLSQKKLGVYSTRSFLW